MDFLKIADDLGITYTEGRSWIQVTCPFCGDSGEHLGFNIEKEYFNCFRCGWHPVVETISELAGVPKWQAADIVERNRTGHHSYRLQNIRSGPLPKSVLLPFGTSALGPYHRVYLRKRGFDESDIRQLEEKYNVRGTGPVGDFKLRIIVPIYHYQKMVTYQGRDITDKSKMRYRACSKEQEVRSIKSCLYAADFADKDYVVVTEGVFDAWKLGPRAVATFGTEVSWPQIKQLADRWKNRFIAFDQDDAGVAASKKLCSSLSVLHGKTYRVTYDASDPGSMKKEQIEKFWKEIKRKIKM